MGEIKTDSECPLTRRVEDVGFVSHPTNSGDFITMLMRSFAMTSDAWPSRKQVCKSSDTVSGENSRNPRTS